MKRILSLIIALFIILSVLFNLASCDITSGNLGNNGTQNGEGNGGGNSSNNGGNSSNNGGNGSENEGDGYVPDCSEGDHLDEDDDEYCDLCNKYVIVVVDFYVLNDLHGKFCDSSTQPGVDELATYLKKAEETDDHVVLMSSGDMWQGTAESSLTGGLIITEWMNEMNFVSMTLGNHEFDWGEDPIRENHEIAEFPFLAINIYDKNTGTLADYCTPSVIVERGDIKIGIIGAIGDCYSSISSDMVEDVYFKVGNELTNLVKKESQKLREQGADLIVYSLHDGYGKSTSGTSSVASSAISSYYNATLSSGYVDLVFEGHSHQSYILKDSSGVYHLQGGGENSGISHVEIEVNSANGNNKVSEANIVKNSVYRAHEDDPATETLEDKYSDIIEFAYADLGIVSDYYSDYEIEEFAAELYAEAGVEKWGSEYNIVLGGGFLRTRSPYDLTAGIKTYADLLSLFPFNNRLVLCSISGSDLEDRFINSTSYDYHSAYTSYGESIKNSISSDATYYVVVDTYTAQYKYNRLTVVEYYDDNVYARDLLADAIKAGRLEK